MAIGTYISIIALSASGLNALTKRYRQAEGWGGKGDGREVWKGGDIGVPMANSC